MDMSKYTFLVTLAGGAAAIAVTWNALLQWARESLVINIQVVRRVPPATGLSSRKHCHPQLRVSRTHQREVVTAWRALRAVRACDVDVSELLPG